MHMQLGNIWKDCTQHKQELKLNAFNFEFSHLTCGHASTFTECFIFSISILCTYLINKPLNLNGFQ